MWQIAGDGGLLPAAVERSTMLISPGERLEVLVDFSYYPVGTQIVLKNRIGVGSTEDILRFDVMGRGGEEGEDDDEEDGEALFARTWAPPEVLRLLPRLPSAQATTTRRFVFAHGPTIVDPWTINGKAYDPARIDARVPLGAIEIWELVSESRMPHPIHLHDIAFQILDRNGVPPQPYEMGWKDTVTLFPGEVVRIIARFDDYRGVYVFHCHMLEHEDFAMMGQFEVV